MAEAPEPGNPEASATPAAKPEARMLRALWSWIPASLQAAADHFSSYPDEEDGFPGKAIQQARPHLVPIGFVLFFSPILLCFAFAASISSPQGAFTWFMTIWVPFTIVGSLWSLGIFIVQRRKQRDEASAETDR